LKLERVSELGLAGRRMDLSDYRKSITVGEKGGKRERGKKTSVVGITQGRLSPFSPTDFGGPLFQYIYSLSVYSPALPLVK
jgi:hypothetical protein